ncbi:MAG: tRNA uridine-5-carboxymethylaminomethyl(34) synthesis GTPase MnmE [Thermodesulfovibrionales bacterium]
MTLPEDTIAAISTPVGPGGIGIVRMSGPLAIPIADRIFRATGKKPSAAKGFSLLHGRVIDPENRGVLDEALLSVMKGPRSYTREDVVEISCHGGMVAVSRLLELVLSQGARLAEPGEFTKRAFLNGRISLTQAEAVLDIIQARTEESMRIAVSQLQGGLAEKLAAARESLISIAALAEAHIDFPEEEIPPADVGRFIQGIARLRQEIEALSSTYADARFFRDGLSVAIIGRPNVGKSSLLNRLLLKDRAIVTETPGTTRDVIEDFLNINGLPVKIMDTAGIRESDERIEQEGIRRSLQAAEDADFVIVMLDGSSPLVQEDRDLLDRVAAEKAIVAVNKSDLPQRLDLDDASLAGMTCLSISAATGDGISRLKDVVYSKNLRNWDKEREGVVVTNLRHKTSLDRAARALERAERSLSSGRPLELFAIDLRDAIDSIAEIAGAVTADEILDRIFSRFCIGK